MTLSSSAALRTSPSRPEDKTAEPFTPQEPTLCVVQLKHQMPGVVHQVVIDPAKIRYCLIRLGEWPGDEANGWQLCENITVLLVIGTVRRTDEGTEVTPRAQ